MYLFIYIYHDHTETESVETETETPRQGEIAKFGRREGGEGLSLELSWLCPSDWLIILD